MIYAESLRHFAQEWIEIQHPAELSEWPWDPKSRLFMINLYSISGDDEITSLPSPFISILLNGLEQEQPWLIDESSALYRGYFQKESFKLPRRYLLSPFVNGEKTVKTNRYSFTSDGYGDKASNWKREDMRLLRILGKRKHIRYSIYNSSEYRSLRNRLDALQEKSGCKIRSAENLMDCTTFVASQAIHSPETMLIQAPITGYLKPIRKSKEYRLINGSLVIAGDDIQMSIQNEPCHGDYSRIRIPFQGLGMRAGNQTTAMENATRTVVYLAVEVPCGVFTFQEFNPRQTVQATKGLEYVQCINHSFTIVPEANGDKIEVRLRQSLTEGLIPKIRENNGFFCRSREKLFYRSDLPPGVTKTGNGEISISIPVSSET